MPIPIRLDEPGSFHHVTNRGAAQRPIFEFERDARKFLSLVARVARDGLLEVVSFVLMTNHFHLYIRSPKGELSKAMQRVELGYVRWFNLVRGRDGPLLKSRFWSRRIFELLDERAVAAYIDGNPVEARLVARPEDYPWSSAWLRARGSPPRWLTPFDPRPRRQSTAAERAASNWVTQQRIRANRGNRFDDPLRHLIHAAPGHVSDWLRQRAIVADGAVCEVPVAAPMALDAALGEVPMPALDAADVDPRLDDLLRPPRVALLRTLCGLDWSAIAACTGLATTTARDAARRHARRIADDERYAMWSAAVTSRAIDATFGREPACPGELHRIERAADLNPI